MFLIVKFVNKRCGPRLKKWYFGREVVRERLGETEAQMLNDSQDLDELSKNIKKERQKKKDFTI
jgi:hypothetical protein